MASPSTVTSLVNLDSVGTTRSFSYDEATLLTPGRYTARSPMTSASFAKVFSETFPNLAGFPWANVCVRGGAVVDLLLARPVKDLDLFFYGLDSDEAVIGKAREVIDFLLSKERAAVSYINEQNDKYKKGDKTVNTTYSYGSAGSFSIAYMPAPLRIDIKAVRVGAVVTVHAGVMKVPMQLVLCKYPTVEAVAAGADMHVCGALFDGETVRMVAEARWSLENMAIRVTDDRFPRMARLQKYFTKGFDIVLPGLDVEKIPQGYLPLGLQDAVVTDAIRFAYTSVTGNRISLKRFLVGSGDEDDGPVARGGRYGEESVTSDKLDSRAVMYENIARLAKYTTTAANGSAEGAGPAPDDSTGVPDFSVFAEADYVGGALSPWPCLTPRQVLNTYAGIGPSISSDGELNMRQFSRFVAVVELRKLLADIAASAPEADVEFECDRIVAEAVSAQVGASNAALPALEAHFEGRIAPVLAPSDTFLTTMVKDANAFYGKYRKTQ